MFELFLPARSAGRFVDLQFRKVFRFQDQRLRKASGDLLGIFGDHGTAGAKRRRSTGGDAPCPDKCRGAGDVPALCTH